MDKACKTCQVTKPITEFYVHKGGRDGHRRSCKSCVQKVQKEGHDPVKAAEAKVRYYARHRDKVLERSKEWRENNREQYNLYMLNMKQTDPEFYKLRARRYNLKREYGLSLDQYDELLERQKGCCAICGRHQSGLNKTLAVDHSHRTKRVRGLLCTGCNYRLVARHEDGDILRKVADYIEQGTEWFVPDKKKRKKRGAKT